MNSLELAHRQRSKKDYKGALAAYDKAAKHNSFITAACLEGKAITYYKMGDLPKAMEEAKHMIRVARTSGKAYMLAGSIAEIIHTTTKGQQRVLELYRRGLDRVDPNDKEHPKLQTAHDRLRSEIWHKKRVNPVDKLPNELLDIIFTMLDMRTRGRCLRVAKDWSSYLNDSPKLWTTLDLRKSPRLISMKALKAFMARSNYTLNTAFVTMVPSGTEHILKSIIIRCRELEMLSVHAGFAGAEIGSSIINVLPMATNLKLIKIGTSCSVSLHTIFSILARCPKLFSAHFCNVSGLPFGVAAPTIPIPQLPYLTELSIHHSPRVVFASQERCSWLLLRLDEMITATPNLKLGLFEGWAASNQIINMPDFSLWTKLEHLSFKDTVIDRLAPLPQSLKCLNLTNHTPNPKNLFMFGDLENTHERPRVVDTENALTHPSQCSLPNLEELHISNCQSISPELFEFLTRASMANGNLRVLNIGSRSPVQDPEKNPYPPCDSLVSLSLSGSAHNESLLAVTEKYPNVQELDLSRSMCSGWTLKQMVKQLVHLSKIILIGNLPELIGDEEYAYLESKGINVVRFSMRLWKTNT